MKRWMLFAALLGLLALPLAIGHAAAPEPTPEPAWKTKARTQLEKAYPKAEEGMVRYAIYLEPQPDERLFRVELIVGKTVETDGVNRYGFGGSIKQETVKGWGYTMHVVDKDAFDKMFSTRKGVPPGTPKVKKFVQIGGGPNMLRYNSKLPIVVYVPAGGEVRYRIWRTPAQPMVAAPG